MSWKVSFPNARRRLFGVLIEYQERVWRRHFMRTTYSYESILRAVGRVLDHTGVKSIALHETENGLIVEGINQEGHTQVRLTYDLADLCNQIDRTEGNVEELFESAHPVTEAKTLTEFLARHQAVAVR
jgi:hypothetical protein